MNIHKIKFGFLLSAALLISCGSNMEGKGAVALYGSSVYLYQENMVELKVPNSVTEKFYKVRWEAQPSNAAYFQYYENKTNDMSLKNDRYAVIIPVKKVPLTIKVYATDKFSKNEYLIAERKITVK